MENIAKVLPLTLQKRHHPRLLHSLSFYRMAAGSTDQNHPPGWRRHHKDWERLEETEYAGTLPGWTTFPGSCSIMLCKFTNACRVLYKNGDAFFIVLLFHLRWQMGLWWRWFRSKYPLTTSPTPSLSLALSVDTVSRSLSDRFTPHDPRL